MTDSAAVGGMERLHLLEEDNEELWNSPSRQNPQKGPNQTVVGDTSSNPSDRPQQIENNQNDTAFDREEAREAALRHELQTVKKINEAIEGVLESLERARINMGVSPPPHMELILAVEAIPEFSRTNRGHDNKTVSRTVESASTLLNTWTRILSQTEHNQGLILNSKWQGASNDIADIESEALAKQEAAQRREVELQQRRHAAQRKAEEEERKKSGAAPSAVRAIRGTSRGRVRTGFGRASSASHATRGQTGTRGTNNISTTVPRKPGTSMTGGPGSARGRGRA